MTNRMTGISGLIDTDALVEATLLRQKTKINTATQNLKIQQYKQEQYRTLMTQAKSFYNNYFDILSGNSLASTKAYNIMKAKSSDSNLVTATASTKAKAGVYKVNVSQKATAATCNISKDTLFNSDGSLVNNKITINNKEFSLEGTTAKEVAEKLNDEIKEYNKTATNKIKVNASYSDFVNNGVGGIVLQTEEKSASADLVVKFGENGSNLAVVAGTNVKAKITDTATGLVREFDGSDDTIGDSIILDEITFNIADETNGEDVVVTVKPDGTELKDKIVDFINDYNSLLGAINTKLYEEYDRSYKPLTDDDKEGLTDGQIEKLEKKAQTGLLRNDSYLTDFADQMKMAMSTIMGNPANGTGTGLSLERIGITPKKDYTTENGLFEIDEDKLLSAIEKDPDGIKDLFLKGITNDSVSSDDGIMSKMTDIMKKQIVNFDSIFARRAGFATGTYATINEMTLDIKDRQKKISELQDAYDTKEDLLYKKYASLESSLASLQSQQSSLSSYFG